MTLHLSYVQRRAQRNVATPWGIRALSEKDGEGRTSHKQRQIGLLRVHRTAPFEPLTGELKQLIATLKEMEGVTSDRRRAGVITVVHAIESAGGPLARQAPALVDGGFYITPRKGSIQDLRRACLDNDTTLSFL